MSELAHIPAPSEATWAGEWHFFKGCCSDHQDWVRYFRVRSWTVEASCADPVAVDMAGIQFPDGSIDNWIALHGDTPVLNADEARMLAARLFRAADGLERIRGGRL